MSTAEVAFAPNLSALVGRPLALLLCQYGGGSLNSLSCLNDAQMRQLGVREMIHGTCHRESLPTAIEATNELMALAKQLQVGILLFAPLLRETLDLDDPEAVLAVDTGAIKKALGILSRKASLAAKTDVGGGSLDGSMGSSLFKELREAFEAIKARSSNGGASGETKALPAPEYFKKTEDGVLKRRGGRQTRVVQEKIAKRNGWLVTGVEAERQALVAEVRFASEETQEERLKGREMRGIEIRAAEQRAAAKKRAREEEERQLTELGVAAKITGAGEFDDLYSIQL